MEIGLVCALKLQMIIKNIGAFHLEWAVKSN